MCDPGAQSRRELAQFTGDMSCGTSWRRGRSWGGLKPGVMGGSGDVSPGRARRQRGRCPGGTVGHGGEGGSRLQGVPGDVQRARSTACFLVLPAAFLAGRGLVPEEGKPKPPRPSPAAEHEKFPGWRWGMSSPPGGSEGFHRGGVAASCGGMRGAHLPVHGRGSSGCPCFPCGLSWTSAAAPPQPQPARPTPAGGKKVISAVYFASQKSGELLVTPGWSSGRTLCDRERCSPAASLGLILLPCSLVPSRALQQHLCPQRFCLCPRHVLNGNFAF